MSRINEGRQLEALRWTLHLTGAASILLVGFATLQGHWLLSSNFSRLKETHRANRELVTQDTELRAEHAAVTTRLQELNDRMAALRARHPSAPREAEFLAQLAQEAERFQVTLRDFRPGSSSARGGAQEMELSLSFTAAYADICRYLDALQRLPRVSRVQQLTLSAPQTTGEPCSGEIKLGLTFGVQEQALTQVTGTQP